MYRLFRHPSGLAVATAEMPHMASVSLGLWAGIGGRHEPAELNGAAKGTAPAPVAAQAASQHPATASSATPVSD